MSQLTVTDSILYADIFRHIIHHMDVSSVRSIADNLYAYYMDNINKCELEKAKILSLIPIEWKVSVSGLSVKLEQLFAKEWTDAVWDNYKECINEVLSYE